MRNPVSELGNRTFLWGGADVGSTVTDRSLAFLIPRAYARAARAPTPDIAVSDEDLMLRTEAGDRVALALLFDRFAHLLLGIGLRVLRDRGEAEDLVQDIFLDLFHKTRGFDPSKGSGRNWVVQLTYWRAFDRRNWLARRQFYYDDTQWRKNTEEEYASSEDQLNDFVTGKLLHGIFQQLSDKQRMTLEMYFFEGCDLREVSERLGETLKNTRHYYYRGLERLRRSVAVRADASKRRQRLENRR